MNLTTQVNRAKILSTLPRSSRNSQFQFLFLPDELASFSFSTDSGLTTNVEDDRLSMLPDDLIHKILSFISIKYAVKTTVLSSRWRFIWTSMPYLNISTHEFLNFHEFVNNLLYRRNDQTDLYLARFSFHGTVSEALLKGILDYALSHNVQQLTDTCSLYDNIDFPLYLFCSWSLKYLSLTGSNRGVHSFVLASTWDLPALTTLRLDHVTFYNNDQGIALFSKCTNLKSLTLTNFSMLESITFTVSHPLLSNLTLEDGYWRLDAISMVAPQLENLTIRSSFSSHLVTAPNLATLRFRSSHLLQFSTDLHSLEKVDLHIYSTHKWSGSRIAALLQQIRSVKFLTLNLEFIEPLSSYMERASLQPSPFSNLKSLKIYPVHIDEAHTQVIVSTKVISYLLHGSPTATFTMNSYEEIKEQQQKTRAFANAIAAQNRMSSLQVLLEEKANTETCMDQREPPVKKAAIEY